MAISNVIRNLRDAELMIEDGSSPDPLVLTVVMDEGDLTWTERRSTIEVKDRGRISGGHLRKGDDVSVSLSFSAKWTQLLGKSVLSGDPLQLYEFLTLASGSGVVSTSGAGEQETLTFRFRVVDPAGVSSEEVVFEKVYRESLSLSEGEDYNVIAFSGKAFVVSPTVLRV